MSEEEAGELGLNYLQLARFRRAEELPADAEFSVKHRYVNQTRDIKAAREKSHRLKKGRQGLGASSDHELLQYLTELILSINWVPLSALIKLEQFESGWQCPEFNVN